MIHLLALVATLLVAVAHFGFMALESFLWTRPAGLRIFAMSAGDAEKTRVLALNQGFYNGAIAAVLVWAALAQQGPTALAVLALVVFVGIVGAVTVKPSIFFLQALPALVALVLQWLAR